MELKSVRWKFSKNISTKNFYVDSPSILGKLLANHFVVILSLLFIATSKLLVDKLPLDSYLGTFKLFSILKAIKV